MEQNNQDSENTKITITFPTNSYFISGLRDFTLNVIKNTTSFPEKWAFRFQSVVDELCNNAIEYGSSPGSEIRVTFIHSPNQYLEITVEDTGTGAKALKAKELQKIYQDRTAPGYVFNGIRGRGLAKIVGEWTDEIEFQDRNDGGIKIRARKYLKNARVNEAGITQPSITSTPAVAEQDEKADKNSPSSPQNIVT